MDRSTRRLGQGKDETPSAPEIDSPIGPFTKVPPGAYPITIRFQPGCEWPNSVPVGTPQRNPSSPFPPETGKRTLETGPSYER